MRKREIIATGLVNDKGDLAMYMGEVREFLKQWKGAKVIVRFSVAQPGTSEALKGYYYNYVVPTLRQAIWENGERLTEEKAERFIREISPIMWEQTPDPATGKYTSRLREINELSNAEFCEHIETLKLIGAQEYCVYIEEPKTI